MANEHHKLSRDKGTQSGLSPIAKALGKPAHGQSEAAQAILRTSANHFNPDHYGGKESADLLGVGAGDFHHPHAREGVGYDQ